jgi:hypothetical protein
VSFAYHARRARDPARSPWLRMSSVKACAACFCRLTGQPFRATLERLGLTWTPLIPRDPPDEAYLRATLDALERARNVYLARLRGWEARRIRAKLRGARHLARAERAALAEARERAGAGLPAASAD